MMRGRSTQKFSFRPTQRVRGRYPVRDDRERHEWDLDKVRPSPEDQVYAAWSARKTTPRVDGSILKAPAKLSLHSEAPFSPH